MPYQAFSILITDVVDLLGLERDPRGNPDASSFNVRCPFCGEGKRRSYKMNINTVKNVYFCPRCMDPTTSNAGALDLYGRVRYGTPLRPGVNGKELYHSLCVELEGHSISVHKEENPRPVPADIEPASDEQLDRAFRALLSLPYLALSKKHGANLLKRGLDRETAHKNHYASLREASIVVKNHPRCGVAMKWYQDNNIEKVRKESPILHNYKKEDVLAGLLIARDLMADGIKLNGVPGFFKLKGAWCFRYDQGMLVPTVSINGHVVGMQVRRDTVTKSGLRYMTVSSKGLDCGVTTKIARTHVAKYGDLNADTTVYVTEGPLKADVILHLVRKLSSSDNFAVVAIQGVNNTKELPAIAAHLRKLGITTAYSALDMDKTGNLSVASAGRTIKAIFAKEGVQLNSITWDCEYGAIKRQELADLCKKNGLAVPDCGNVFVDIYRMANELNSKHIEYNVYWSEGKMLKNHWRDETKGLDDYLNFILNGGAA